MSRRYEQKKRAVRQEETRRRIVDAAIHFHETVGPAKTTITEIAERAGVGRLTVYRHFPDELTLTWACSGLYWERNPFPDPEPWRKIDHPQDRFRQALRESYSYHRRTEQMMTRALADLPNSPVIKPYIDHWSGVVDVVSAAWGFRGRKAMVLKAAVGHALGFQTWQSLVRHHGLTDKQAVELMIRLSPTD
jgi:AcrR family transcriptional regulator